MKEFHRMLVLLPALAILMPTLIAQQGGFGLFRSRTSVTTLVKAESKPDDAEIDVLASPPRDRDYEDVCLINAKGGQTVFNARNSEDLIDAMKKDARKCGADAIIIGSAEDRSWHPFQGGVTQSKASVLAIRYVE